MLRDTLKTLLAAYGPSGNEHTVAETVKGLIASHVDSMRVDAMGNLIVESWARMKTASASCFPPIWIISASLSPISMKTASFACITLAA